MQAAMTSTSLAGSHLAARAHSARRPQRVSVVAQAERKQQAVPAALGAALLAAHFAVSGPALAGPLDAFLPKTATSQSARDSLNEKTSELPSLKQTGKDLVGGGDPAGVADVKDIGKKIDRNTPNAGDAADAAKGAVQKGKNAVSNLSAVPSSDEIQSVLRARAGKAGSNIDAFSGGAGKKAASYGNKAGGQAKSAAKGAFGSGNLLPSSAKKVASKANEVKKKAFLTMSTFDLAAGLQGEGMQSTNDDRPELGASKRAQAGTNAGLNTTGNLRSPEDYQQRSPPAQKVSEQSPGADVGVSSVKDLSAPSLPSPPSIPNPVEKVKGLFGQ